MLKNLLNLLGMAATLVSIVSMWAARRIVRLLLPMLVGFAGAERLASQVARPDDPINLEPVHVDARRDLADQDETGMGAREAELSDPPFSNDLVTAALEESEAVGDLNLELSRIAAPSPADLVAGLTRLNLRGFPTPRLRNGFIQLGVPEVLNAESGERIQGPLTPVLGKAAPGGIENFVTERPRARRQTRVLVTATTARERTASVEHNAPLVAGKSWQRWMVGARQRSGPEAFAVNRQQLFSGAVTLKHSPAMSTLLQLDYTNTDANPGSGIPEYRESRGAPVRGPYLPLAYLHVNGPDGRIRKQVASASAQWDAQVSRSVSVRAGAQWFWRSLVEDRFTKGEFLLDERVFAGVREPQHTEQPWEALNGGVEVTTRFSSGRADHKLLVSLQASRADSTRVQRGLDAVERAALPESVRRFDPEAPDYFRPSFGPGTYRRIIADRSELATYTALAITERMALAQGRTVLTAGLRRDSVDLDVEDRRPGVSRDRLSDGTGEVTWLAGANHQLQPGRVLLFANASTAFEPSTRVDARTNRIQGNETTRGVEGGVKTLTWGKRLTATVLGFWYLNENISRRNPLFDDPIADANQTQPQLVAAGGERFSGATMDLRCVLSPAWVLTGRATHTRAITTASPDLPDEVGRPLTRLPAETVALGARHTVARGRWKGLVASWTLTHVGGFVASYAERNRTYLEYPSYTLFGTAVNYSWEPSKTTRHTLGLAVRNATDLDLLARVARVGSGRTVSASYRASF